MEEIRVQADPAQLGTVIQFLDERLEECGCGMKAKMQIDVAAEEIFVNIAHYAYPEKKGTAAIRFAFHPEENAVTIQFIDSGTPYNPLAHKEPDTTLSLSERKIGGLGILMVKKTMDNVAYEHKDGFNILTLQKSVATLSKGK